jgi:hypothetical protein
MSLEQQIAELNENIKALIGVFAKGVNSVHTPEPLQAKIEKVVAEKGPTAAKSEIKKLIAEEQKPAEVEMEPAAFYDKVLRPAAQALIVKHGSGALVALLKEYEVATLPKLPTEAYGEMLAKIQEATGA